MAPEVSHFFEDCLKVVTAVAVECSDDILPDCVSGKSSSSCILHLPNDSCGLKKQVGA